MNKGRKEEMKERKKEGEQKGSKENDGEDEILTFITLTILLNF